MRKHIFNQIIEILLTVQDGIEFAMRAEPEEARALLCDCYDATSAISDSLQEKLNSDRFGEYSELLDDFKEMLEDLNQCLARADDCTNISLQIESHLQLIKNKLLNEKLEIVFMPYSASMWDCMESIWKAAKEDSRCECYVVPIPYYERNTDTSLGKFHYEGSLFPQDIPVVHYENYDISVRKPDIIYIHNPFDGYNLVTSVDPRYYSYELKKHTGMLVYVPYYVTDGTIPESQIRVSAIQYADKVIVQSERVKEQHLNYISPEKIVALGSPKIDKVLECEKHKLVLPDNWKEMILDKKVVLYNISLTALLTYGSKVLDRLRYVFSNFEGRDDVVLLWRPHPLSDNTMSSMRPQLLQEYIQLENEFKTKQIGIFDDTPDVERAIAISDAYLGDGTSSLVHMFGITGKPILIQDLNIDREPNEEELQSVWFGNAEFDGDYAWFSSGGHNGLCKINLHTGEAEYVAEIPRERRDGHLLYSSIVKLENKLLLTPLFGREIAEYDLIEREFKKIPLDSVYSSKFLKAVSYKQFVFFTPYMSQVIIKYDTQTGKSKYYTEWLDKLKPYITNLDKPIFANGICVRDNLLLMAFAQNNLVMEFDMNTGETRVHTVGREGNNYWSMTFDGKDYWLIQNDNKNAETIVRWNYETGKTTEFFDFPEGFVGEQNNFNEIVFCGKYLLAFPRFSNMIVKIDITSGRLSEFKTRLTYKEGERKSNYYSLKCNYYFARLFNDEYIIALSMYDHSLIKINIKTEEVSKIKIVLNKEDLESYISFGNYYNNADYSTMDYLYTESKYLTIKHLLDHITSDKYRLNTCQVEAYKRIINNADGTCGQKAHQYIIQNYKP